MNKVGNEILSALVNLKGDPESWEQGINQLERLVIGIKTTEGGNIPYNLQLTPSNYLAEKKVRSSIFGQTQLRPQIEYIPTEA